MSTTSTNNRPRLATDGIEIIDEPTTASGNGKRGTNAALHWAHSHSTFVLGAASMLFGLALTTRWFERGKFLSTGDVSPFVRTGLVDELGWTWNHLTTGAGAPTTGIGQYMEIVLLGITHTLRIPDTVAQWLFYGLIVGFAAVGAGLFVKALGVPSRFAGAAGFVVVMNPLMMTLMPNVLPFLSIGLMGTLGAQLLNVAKGGRRHVIAMAAVSLGLSYISLNPPLLAIIMLWLAGTVALSATQTGFEGVKRCATLLVRVVPLAVLFNLWWIVPTLQSIRSAGVGTSFSAVTDTSSWAFTHQRASFLNVSALVGAWGWPFTEYYPWSKNLDGGVFAIIRYALPLAALASPFICLRRRVRLAAILGFAALLLIFLCKGLHEPLRPVNMWIYDHVPGFWLFREPIAKFGPALLLVYGALVAMALESMVRSRGTEANEVRQRKVRIGVVGAVALCIAAFSYPMWTGSVVPDKRPSLPPAHVAMPHGWYDAASYVNDDKTPGKALVLPLDDYYQMPTTWGFYGADVIPRHLIKRAVVMRLPGGYYGEAVGYDTLIGNAEQAIRTGDVDQARAALHALGVSQVVLRNDFDPSMFPDRKIASSRDYRATLAALSSQSKNFGVADVFKLPPDAGTLVDVQSHGAPLQGASWKQASPARYKVTVPAGNNEYTLTLRESFADGWKIKGLSKGASIQHVQVDGYANAWQVQGNANSSLSLEYEPAYLGQWAIRASVISLIAAIGAVVFLRRNEIAAWLRIDLGQKVVSR